MKNIDKKASLVQSGKYAAFCWDNYVNRLMHNWDTGPNDYGLSEEEFIACSQLRDAKSRCWSRLYDHMRFILAKYGKDNIFFMTFTFNNETMQLKPNTRRQIIHRMLNANCEDYIANIDFGDTTEREHYHAVIVPKMPLNERFDGKYTRICADWLDKYGSKYGFYKAEKVQFENGDIEKISRYIAKLCNHSIKVKQSKIMTKKASAYQQFMQHRNWSRIYKHEQIDNA